MASRLIQNGESLAYVNEQTGHDSIKVTVDIDGKLVPGANKAAVDRLAADKERLRMAHHPQPPRDRHPETQNPRGRAGAEPRGFEWWS